MQQQPSTPNRLMLAVAAAAASLTLAGGVTAASLTGWITPTPGDTAALPQPTMWPAATWWVTPTSNDTAASAPAPEVPFPGAASSGRGDLSLAAPDAVSGSLLQALATRSPDARAHRERESDGDDGDDERAARSAGLSNAEPRGTGWQTLAPNRRGDDDGDD